MPLGRRTDCGDARFAGTELALPASDPEASLQVKTAAQTLHNRLARSSALYDAQDIANCGFDFIASPLRRSSDEAGNVGALQPLTYANALLAPVGRSGQVRKAHATLQKLLR